MEVLGMVPKWLGGRTCDEKHMKPKEFFDNSLVQEIQASGFIDEVNR